MTKMMKTVSPFQWNAFYVSCEILIILLICANAVTEDDIEQGGNSSSQSALIESTRPPLSVIIPVYRRDCQEEVYAGSHTYPGQGVYLLKFDNSYSLWRSKTLYYRVYYTR